MEKYIGVKLIEAEPQNVYPPEAKGQYSNPGYKVVYPDGYVSWSPKDVFEEAYRNIDGLTFGLAVEALKKGFKIAREGWNGNKKISPTFIPQTREPIIYMGLCYLLLNTGEVAYCDESDFNLIDSQIFHINKGYPCFSDYNNEGKLIRLHQLLNPTWGMTDHINGNRLDNRRYNLRECTSKENNVNRGSKKNVTSQYKGVSFDTSRNKWISSIQINKRTKHIGRFDNEIECAKAYDKKSKEIYGEFARLNFEELKMFVYYIPANSYPSLTDVAKKEFGDFTAYNPYLAIKTVSGNVSTWVPSVNDCLAEDWTIVE